MLIQGTNRSESQSCVFAGRIPAGGLGTVERGGASPARLDGAGRFHQFPTPAHCLPLLFPRSSSVPVMAFCKAWPTFSGVLGCRDSSACSSSALLPPPPHPPRPFQLLTILPRTKANLSAAHLGCKRAVMQSRARAAPAPGLCRAISLLI